MNENWAITAIVIVLILMIVVPITVYFAAKLGRMGFLRGEHLFKKSLTNPNEKESE